MVKYGYPIGHATAEIKAGEWVHTHNMATNLEGEVVYTYEPEEPVLEPAETETFMGYPRPDGRAGRLVGRLDLCDGIFQQRHG